MAESEQPTAAASAGATDRFGRAVDSVLVALSAAVLFLLMMLTVVDVLGRYLLNLPLPGGYELTEVMMAALVFAALPVVTRREDHIVIDLFDQLVPQRAVMPRQIAVYLLCGAVTALWSWRTWLLGDRYVGYGEVTEYLQIPLAPICYFISVMSGLTTAVFAYLIWRHATGRGRVRTAMHLS